MPIALPSGLDPRRSLAAGALWLIVALAVAFSVSGAVWVGSIARANILEQHVRRLALETDQLGSELSQAIAARLDAIRAAQRLLSAAGGATGALQRLFDELTSAYPELDWIGIADPNGLVVSGGAAWARGTDVSRRPEFVRAARGPWIGVIDDGPPPGGAVDAAGAANAGGAANARGAAEAGGTARGAPRSISFELGDLTVPVRDESGHLAAVIAVHLRWQRAPHHPLRLTDESNAYGSTQAYVLSRDGVVLVGPSPLLDRPWSGVPIDRHQDPAGAADSGGDGPRFERLPDARRVLVARAPLGADGTVAAAGWHVLLSEPIERVYQRAQAVAFEILWVSLGLGAATALLGALGTRKLTARLQRLTHSVAAVGHDADARIAIPGGADEVAQLARAFARILDDLRRERRELQRLSSELERRVAVRTQEVERLAEEARYAAVVRERLKIARELHDTLAHSMMAMLSEIRSLRRLQARDPASVAEELARAEQIAHEGLKEARTAITQMRGNAVRDIGLGAALAGEFERFRDRTGIAGEYRADAESGHFGDERAETLLRIAQEALRNVERHAMATRATVTLASIEGRRLELRIEDDGVGFDPRMTRPGHYGLVGLREQAELIGADLRIDSAPDKGTRLTVSLPMSPVPFGKNEH